jgi:hypothetical protein
MASRSIPGSPVFLPRQIKEAVEDGIGHLDVSAITSFVIPHGSESAASFADGTYVYWATTDVGIAKASAVIKGRILRTLTVELTPWADVTGFKTTFVSQHVGKSRAPSYGVSFRSPALELIAVDGVDAEPLKGFAREARVALDATSRT